MPRFKTSHIFLLIFLLGAFLRFYRLPETMQFLGDQGRDALIVRRMLIERHPALIGPVTSVGNMYLGPFYYYFMLLPLMLTYPSPTGPAWAVALVGLFTLYLIYRLGSEMFGKNVALFSSFIFAISPLVLMFSRFSWNPNIVPLFSLLLFWHLYKALSGSDRAWVWVGLWFSILVQLHYIALILGGVAGLVWIYSLVTKLRQKTLNRSFVVSTVVAILIFLISLTPLVIFDIRHEYLNLKAFGAFFQGSDESHFATSISLYGRVVSIAGIFVRNLTALFGIDPTQNIKNLLFLILLPFIVFIWRKRTKFSLSVKLLLFTYTVSVIGLSVYKGTLYDHYLAFMYPLSALVLGVFISHLWKKIILKLFVVLILLGMTYQAVSLFPGNQNLGYNVFMMKRTADAIRARLSPGETYDILLFTNTNDYQGMNYRYFLSTGDNQPASEEQINEFKTLFVLDEQNLNNPIGGPQYKIAIWPNRDIVDKFEISGGPRVFVLKR